MLLFCDNVILCTPHLCSSLVPYPIPATCATSQIQSLWACIYG